MTQGTSISIGCAIGWAASHFLYQALFGTPDWGEATERAFFSLAVIGAVWLAVRGEFKTAAENRHLLRQAAE